MRNTVAAVVLLVFTAVPVGAQGRGGRDGDRAQGLPPGQLPPSGACRVWYDDRPAGRQPPPVDCREAERVASRSRHARVIYGGGGGGRYGYPARDPYGRGAYGYQRVPFDNGYQDGLDKGREDARDNDSHDPLRHSRYRSGDHGYDRRFGSKAQYKNVYRDGFRSGYDAGYREANAYRRDRRQGGIWVPWPF